MKQRQRWKDQWRQWRHEKEWREYYRSERNIMERGGNKASHLNERSNFLHWSISPPSPMNTVDLRDDIMDILIDLHSPCHNRTVSKLSHWISQRVSDWISSCESRIQMVVLLWLNRLFSDWEAQQKHQLSNGKNTIDFLTELTQHNHMEVWMV